ncbi:MAG: phospholipid carrier-dependent glycosyltransferase [Chloroflexi bacterium]|nr:phospholipid carrier-dependent glycosyltransferase [Chloroflexota bacterium]
MLWGGAGGGVDRLSGNQFVVSSDDHWPADTVNSWQRRLDALWMGLLALYVLAGAQQMPFHGDESTLIYMGRDYHYLFVEGDLTRLAYDPSWSISPAEQHLRLLNGTISKTIYGALAHGLGFSAQEINEQWAWNRDYNWNEARGRIPNQELLGRARFASAAQLALAALCFFALLRLTMNRRTAWLGSALFVLHPNMLINGRRAMMEGSHLLGLMLALLAGAWLLQERRWWRYALLGICAGIALATKHPNSVACALVLASCAIIPIWRLLRWRDESALRDLAGLVLAGGIMIAVFLLLNPAWWDAPLNMPALALGMRADLLQGQVDAFGGYRGFAEQVAGFFQFVFVGARQYFEVAAWAGYAPITVQIAAYESSGWAGLLFIGSAGRLGLLCLLLAVLGALSLARDKNVSAEHRRLLLIWIGGTALFTLLITPLPWARYYLPLLPGLIILVAHALVTIAAWLWRKSRQRDYGNAGLA